MAKSALNKNKPAVNNAATKKADINNGKAGDTKTPPAKVKHIVTEEDLTNNPDLVTQGVKVGDEIKIDAPAPEKGADNLQGDKPSGKGATDNGKKSLKDKMESYKEQYPENKIFYITSDGQVFLEPNKRDAETHQKTLGDSELQTFE